MVELEIAQIRPEIMSGVPVVVKRIDLPAKDLMAIATQVSGKGGVAFLLSRNGERADAVITSGVSSGKCR